MNLRSPDHAVPAHALQAQALRVGIAGLGNIGSALARWLAGTAPPALQLSAAAGRDIPDLAARLKALGHPHARALALSELAAHCDVVVDCLDPSASEGFLETCVDTGRVLVPVSVSVLLARPDLIDRARRAGTRLLVPSGAVAGLDALRAAAQGRIHSVKVITRKPPAGLDEGANSAPRRLFAGSAQEACRAWPRNVNIAATLSLAGLGGAHTQVEIWSDPALDRNVHEIEIDSDSTRIRMSIANLPSADNPRSSAITAHSVCAVLLGLVDPVRIGT
jgi:aspartate dehydrogenase